MLIIRLLVGLKPLKSELLSNAGIPFYAYNGIRRKEQDVTMLAEDDTESINNNWFLACPQLDDTGKRGALTRFRRRIKTLRHSKYFHTVEVEEKLLMLPAHLIQQCIQFHHTSLGHPGKARTKAAIGESYYW